MMDAAGSSTHAMAAALARLPACPRQLHIDTTSKTPPLATKTPKPPPLPSSRLRDPLSVAVGTEAASCGAGAPRRDNVGKGEPGNWQPGRAELLRFQVVPGTASEAPSPAARGANLAGPKPCHRHRLDCLHLLVPGFFRVALRRNRHGSSIRSPLTDRTCRPNQLLARSRLASSAVCSLFPFPC